MVRRIRGGGEGGNEAGAKYVPNKVVDISTGPVRGHTQQNGQQGSPEVISGMKGQDFIIPCEASNLAEAFIQSWRGVEEVVGHKSCTVHLHETGSRRRRSSATSSTAAKDGFDVESSRGLRAREFIRGEFFFFVFFRKQTRDGDKKEGHSTRPVRSAHSQNCRRVR